MEFGEPPVSKQGQISARWKIIVAELKEHPNQWALVGNFSPGVATHLRRGKYTAFLEGFTGDDAEMTRHMAEHWQITTRKTDLGRRNDVYVRWVG